LTTQGTVYEIQTNIQLNSSYGHHVFTALVYVNITHVVWASDRLMSDMSIKNLENSTWNKQNTIVIAYDKPESIHLSKGQLIEASGCYYTVSVSVYVNKLVDHPDIQGSYVKIL